MKTISLWLEGLQGSHKAPISEERFGWEKNISLFLPFLAVIWGEWHLPLPSGGLLTNLIAEQSPETKQKYQNCYLSFKMIPSFLHLHVCQIVFWRLFIPFPLRKLLMQGTVDSATLFRLYFIFTLQLAGCAKYPGASTVSFPARLRGQGKGDGQENDFLWHLSYRTKHKMHQIPYSKLDSPYINSFLLLHIIPLTPCCFTNWSSAAISPIV